MRVLHVYKTYFSDAYGGVETIIYNLAEGTRKYGVDAEVFTVADKAKPGTIKIANHLVHRAKRLARIASTDISLSAFWAFRKLAPQFDLMHYHYPWPLMDAAHFFASVKVPTVVSYQCEIVKQKYLRHLYKPLQKRFFSSVAAIVASSQNYVDSSPVLAQYCDKVRVIPLGLDPGALELAPCERLDFWTAKFGRGFFLFLGVLRYYKGVRYLIEAARQVQQTIVVAGGGGEEAELKRQAERLGVDNVHFTGVVSEADKAALLQLCGAFVFPSCHRSESFGLSLVEAALCRKPLISCEIGSGTSFVNINGETGLVVEPHNAAALANAMRTLQLQPELAEKMGNAAYARAMAMFTADRMSKAYVELYRELLDSSHSR